MKRIGLLSDTHGFLDERIFVHFKDCDEIWHAGDIGGIDVLEKLEQFKPIRAVFGNIDDHKVRAACPEHQYFMLEGHKVWITHIGGFPGHYSPYVRDRIYKDPPDIFICGHSHILKIMPDKKLNLLHINPGACGHHGFHKVRTLVRFALDQKKILDMEVIELGGKSILP